MTNPPESALDGVLASFYVTNRATFHSEAEIETAREELRALRERLASQHAALLQAETFMDHLERNLPIDTPNVNRVTAARTHDMIRAALDTEPR
jgi:hypothetical protein